MIEVFYNHKSDFANSWITGSQRFRDNEEMAQWLRDKVAKYGPVLVTNIEVRK